jgi:hypothetical protein
VLEDRELRLSEWIDDIGRLMDETKDKAAVLERAQLLGTLNKVDRKAQYQGPEYAKPEHLLEAVNVQGNHIRGVQADVGRVQHQVYNLRLRNSLIVAAVTALLARAPEICAWVSKLVR